MIRTGRCFLAVISERRLSEGFSQEESNGEATGLHLEGKQDLLEQFEDGSGVGGDGNDPVLRRCRGLPG